MNNVERDKVIGVFEVFGQRVITHLDWENFIACTRLMPHFGEVQEICNLAIVRHVASEAEKNQQRDYCDKLDKTGASTDPRIKGLKNRLRSRYRNVNRSLDRWILTCWVNCGFWLFINEERRLLMKFLLKNQPRYRGLDSSDAFRHHCKNLGVVGWNDFRSSYLDAPLRYKGIKGPNAQFSVAELWKDFFLPILS
jgi:hypothetical protein